MFILDNIFIIDNMFILDKYIRWFFNKNHDFFLISIHEARFPIPGFILLINSWNLIFDTSFFISFNFANPFMKPGFRYQLFYFFSNFGNQFMKPGFRYQVYFIFFSNFVNLRWNLKNLSRGLNPPKSAKTRFKFSAGLNLETFDTILSGTNHI